MCNSTIETVVKLFESTLPILGICLGNQIIASCCRWRHIQIKIGHRGQNKGCTDRIQIKPLSPARYGYGGKANTLNKTGFKDWYINSDDNTIEGIKHESKTL